MSAAEDLTWDIRPARRPSLEDVGGATLIDDAENPPDPETMPYADQLNQLQKQAQAVGRAIFACGFELLISGGVPAIGRVSAPSTTVDASAFGIVDNGNGDTTVTWPAGTFPTPALPPKAYMTSDGSWLDPIVLEVANGLRIKTRNSAGTLTDGNCGIQLW